jgi:peptidoglycan L-alanyl-D-glutamate endopeptidase CwlK
LPGTVCISLFGIRYVPAWNNPVGSKTPPDSPAVVDLRSETNIATLLPEVRPYARALVQRAADLGITIKVISGTRTYEKQNELYAQGRTKPGKKVTNAKGGQSNHNFGIAFDVGVFKGKKYLEESPDYKKVGHLGVELGLDWGGNWKSIQDEPHFDLRPPWAKDLTENEMLEQLGARTSSGQDIFDSGED